MDGTNYDDVKECDVLVIGGGPAGSTAAALLAQKGHRVTVVEKTRHPRFHIGESLLPANLRLFEALGVAEEIRAIGMMKWAAEFESPTHDHKQVFEFSEAWDETTPYSYQVQRAEFDEILFRNATRKGAITIEGCRVTDVTFLSDDSGVRVRAKADDGTEHTWQARFLLDASGRDTFIGTRLKAKVRNKKHNSTAVYAHFTDVRRNEGKNEGNITIFWFPHGWIWLIPLANGKTSIGAVVWPYYLKSRTKPMPAFLMDTLKLCPLLMKRMQDAKLASEVTATGNYSYVCNHTHGRNYLLLGDAYTFIDPVFSSGVMLAMQSAFVGADAADTCLTRPAEERAALKRFDKSMRTGPATFSWFIYRVSGPTMRELFMYPRNFLSTKKAVLSVLAGDVFGRSPIGPSLLLFKIVYYVTAFLSLPRTLAGWRARKNNIRECELTGWPDGSSAS